MAVGQQLIDRVGHRSSPVKNIERNLLIRALLDKRWFLTLRMMKSHAMMVLHAASLPERAPSV
jgi:hypothetical protein